MNVYQIPIEINESNLIEFDLFKQKDASAVTDLKPIKDLEASEAIIATVLNFNGWYGFSYDSPTGSKIGYGTSYNNDINGLTEAQSYSQFIAMFKEAERKFKRVSPITSMSQTQYDALLSLFYTTGDFKYVGDRYNKVFIGDFIKNRMWDYVATAMTIAGGDRLKRQREASIMMLADYGKNKSRPFLKEEGIQLIRKKYPSGFTQMQKQQAEVVYYAETKRFLPLMTQSRQRQVVKIVESK